MILYLAGFFDGEGCITIGKNGSLSVGVVNTNKEVLELFVKHFGGTVANRKQIVNKKQYVWKVYGETAVNTLHKLEMHLIEKQEQAHTALNWMEVERNKYQPIRTGKRGGNTHPEREQAIKKYQTILTEQKLGTYIEQRAINS